MKFQHIHLDQIDSTSNYLQSYLETNPDVKALVVSADRQTSGRGQRGHSWLSPEGNLYLSFGITKSYFSTDINISIIPLNIAGLLCEWLWQIYHLRFTIKWPNDLLFSGRKVAGILCESMTHGRDFEYVIIGIGVNVNVAPIEQQSTCLADILNQRLIVGEIRDSLIQYFENHQPMQEQHPFFDLFQKYAIEVGQPWINPKNELLFYNGLTDDGNLRLENSEKQLLLNSASHDQLWLYQKNLKDLPIFIADIGNHQTKIAYYSHFRDSMPKDFESFGLIDDIKQYLEQRQRDFVNHTIFADNPIPLHAVYVNHERYLQLDECCRQTGFVLINTPKRNVGTFVNRYNFSHLGIDRLALMEGCVSQCKEERWPFVCVSVGTAVTVDCVDQNLHHLGGWILPGFHVTISGLHQATDQLPEFDIHKSLQNQDFLGSDTKSAVALGAKNMLVSAIQNAVQHLSKYANRPVKLFITGGDASLLKDQLPQAHYSPTLLVEGIRTMALGGW